VPSTPLPSRTDRDFFRGFAVASPTEEEVLAEIRRIVARELEITGPIQSHHGLIQDLRLDSLGLTVLAVGLEDRFRVRLTEEDSALINTVQDLARLVASRAGGVAG
jgi:acyl carrier protein